jgi:D-beta-D-heptose 7-phosphate kinase/D-beta-D-heptose 1-phosphate adenosyltransferase
MTELTTIQQQKQFNILLIGDDCLDVYQYGTVERISPEAPVPIFKFSHEANKAGMAGNVCNNLQTLGCRVNYLHGKTSIKTRLIDIRSKQQIVRIDNDAVSPPISFETALPDVYDAIVISDYNKGTVSYNLIEELRKEFKGPIFIDTKKTDLARFEGCFVKINNLEYTLASSYCQDLIVTLGPVGARYQAQIVPAPIVEVSDVTGAGDTFLSALVFAYLDTQDILTSIDFANRASSLTVQHLGVYAPTMEEIDAT